MDDELERTGKETFVIRLLYYPGIDVDGLG